MGFYRGQSGRELTTVVEFELQSVKIRLLGVWIKFSLYAFSWNNFKKI